MQGRAFLDLAREIIQGATEQHWRGATGRAYYGLMLECREALSSWSFRLPPRETVHAFVRDRFLIPTHPDLKSIGDILDSLSRLRNRVDYDLSALREFSSAARAQRCLQDAAAALVLLDGIDNDPVRRRNAIAAIRALFP